LLPVATDSFLAVEFLQATNLRIRCRRMKTLEEAKAVALEQLARLKCDLSLAINERATREFDVGWVFYYQSERYIETGDMQYALAGNAPIFVPRESRPVWVVGYHRPIEESMVAYRACGDPNAELQPRVALTGVSPGALLVEGIKQLQVRAAMGMGEAKRILEGSCRGDKCEVAVASVDDAKGLVGALLEVGFKAEMVYAPPRRGPDYRANRA